MLMLHDHKQVTLGLVGDALQGSTNVLAELTFAENSTALNGPLCSGRAHTLLSFGAV